jgi:phosphohistidine phosphatase
MDLILWRHAFAKHLPSSDAATFEEDMARELTPKGHMQAKAAAKWLHQRLGSSTRVLSSPAIRCLQTAHYLDMDVKTLDVLGPMAGATDILQAVKWPLAKTPVLVVGHQPALGQALAALLQCSEQTVSVKKAGIWWLRHRVRDGIAQTTVMAVVAADLVHGG